MKFASLQSAAGAVGRFGLLLGRLAGARSTALGVLGGALLGAAALTPAQAATKTIRIAFIDPLSGPFGSVGIIDAKGFEYMINKINASGELGDYKLKLVLFDNKVNPGVSLVDAEKAADDGIRYILQGNGSNVAFALVNWIKKHNRLHPDDKMLYLNYAAIDPGLSNKDCGFYHFNFDANVNMKMAGLVNYIATQKNIKKVFLINMDYSFGHSVADAAKIMLKRERPDIQIVGDAFTPIGQTKDYTPYIYKIKKSGAQAVITGNWGADMSLLAKAAGQADLQGVQFYTFYAGIPGTPQAIGDAGAGRVMQITPWVGSAKSAESEDAAAFEKAYGDNWYYGSQVYLTGMLAKAIKEAGSADPTQVALHLEGMHYETPVGDVYMRADNNAAVMPMYLSILEKGTPPAGTPKQTGTDLYWKMVQRIPAIKMMLPSSCQMERPKGAKLANAFYGNTGQ